MSNNKKLKDSAMEKVSGGKVLEKAEPKFFRADFFTRKQGAGKKGLMSLFIKLATLLK